VAVVIGGKRRISPQVFRYVILCGLGQVTTQANSCQAAVTCGRI